MNKKADFLVLGSGIAGLSFAIKASEYGNVIVLSKDVLEATATDKAQGGIAAVMYSPDTYEKHIADTINAGDKLSDPEVVAMTITESTARVKELIEWGTNFDKNIDGSYNLGREGGHTEKRILHYKDSTGSEIQRALIDKVKKSENIELLENHFAIDLITQHHLGEKITRNSINTECYGVYALDIKSKNIYTILSKVCMIATGGTGMVYKTTTNPVTATGDGIAMVYRAKGEVSNMEFIQFHPTALYNPGENPAFLITEALRGYGAILVNKNEVDFVKEYDERGSLAPRDIVARAIDNELKRSGEDCVFLDARHIPKKDLLKHFPGIYAKCLSIGIDISKEKIPVLPAEHYICGGIQVNKNGQTSIKNLYASGEASYTGLHGANRLASNSLLEAAVFSHRAIEDAKTKINELDFKEIVPDWDDSGTVLNEEKILISQSLYEVQSIMQNYVGIVRSNLRLNRALTRLKIIYLETEKLYDVSKLDKKICELRNIITIAFLIIKMAQNRKESRGLHYSIDYPPKK